jgi:alanine dehydrogenase
VQDGRSLPLLAPMSEVAGRLSVQVGAYSLMAPAGGPGVLLGGVPGVRAAKVVVLGAGVAGTNAAAMALGAGADVTILDININRLRELDALYQGRLKTVASNKFEIERSLMDADLVIGSVLIPGAKAPKLVTNEMVSRMKPGSVLVDIAVDQGGCFEDSHPTTHENPTFRVHNSLFYCVANMPGAVPNTSTYALTNVTLRYAASLANLGVREALMSDAALAAGLNVAGGHITNRSVAVAHGQDMTADWTGLLGPAAVSAA